MRPRYYLLRSDPVTLLQRNRRVQSCNRQPRKARNDAIDSPLHSSLMRALSMAKLHPFCGTICSDYTIFLIKVGQALRPSIAEADVTSDRSTCARNRFSDRYCCCSNRDVGVGGGKVRTFTVRGPNVKIKCLTGDWRAVIANEWCLSGELGYGQRPGVEPRAWILMNGILRGRPAQRRTTVRLSDLRRKRLLTPFLASPGSLGRGRGAGYY
jgi:hypothetical protein